MTRFFDHELRPTTRYTPDTGALSAGPARVVVGIGADSDRLITYRTSMALATLLGVSPVEFPGDHGGFIGKPGEFAATLARGTRVVEVLPYGAGRIERMVDKARRWCDWSGSGLMRGPRTSSED